MDFTVGPSKLPDVLLPEYNRFYCCGECYREWKDNSYIRIEICHSFSDDESDDSDYDDDRNKCELCLNDRLQVLTYVESRRLIES